MLYWTNLGFSYSFMVIDKNWLQIFFSISVITILFGLDTSHHIKIREWCQCGGEDIAIRRMSDTSSERVLLFYQIKMIILFFILDFLLTTVKQMNL